MADTSGPCQLCGTTMHPCACTKNCEQQEGIEILRALEQRDWWQSTWMDSPWYHMEWYRFHKRQWEELCR